MKRTGLLLIKLLVALAINVPFYTLASQIPDKPQSIYVIAFVSATLIMVTLAAIDTLWERRNKD